MVQQQLVQQAAGAGLVFSLSKLGTAMPNPVLVCFMYIVMNRLRGMNMVVCLQPAELSMHTDTLSKSAA